MSNHVVYFLGNTYQVPDELRVFVEYLQDFDEIKDEIMSLLTKQMQEQNFSGGADEDFVYFEKPLVKMGEKVITKLSEQGIYNITINDLVYKNKGYIQLKMVCTETFQGMVDILTRSIETFTQGYNDAQENAISQITGSDVAIWTNSVTGAMLYSAIEASTLKKQSDKAVKQYSEAMSKLNYNIDNEKQRQEKMLLANKYYPGVAQSLTLFVSDMFETYIQKLQEQGQFDYSKIEAYNLQRSTDLLKNIVVVKDKHAVLEQAFLYCPYNPDIYQAVIDTGLIDLGTFETAKYFHQSEILQHVLVTYCDAHKSDFDKLAVPIKILASMNEKDEKSIWGFIYRDSIAKYEEKCQEIEKLITDQDELVEWIFDYITMDAVELCGMSVDAISGKVEDKGICSIISEEQYNFLTQLGLIRVGNPKKYVERLLESIMSYITRLQIQIKQCKSEIEENERQYRELQEKCNNEKEYMSSELFKLREQRKSLGIFALGKKREIDIKISQYNDKIRNYESRTNKKLNSLKFKNRELDQKMHSLEIS